MKDKVRIALFWDTDIDEIDWEKHKRYVIKRVLERGTQSEIKALIEFYSLPIIKAELALIKNSTLPNYTKNIDKYINVRG